MNSKQKSFTVVFIILYFLVQLTFGIIVLATHKFWIGEHTETVLGVYLFIGTISAFWSVVYLHHRLKRYRTIR